VALLGGIFIFDVLHVEVERFCIDEFNGGVVKISKSLPGCPISQDGRHWARIEGEHHGRRK
jgi:hypothetical protein